MSDEEKRPTALGDAFHAGKMSPESDVRGIVLSGKRQHVLRR